MKGCKFYHLIAKKVLVSSGAVFNEQFLDDNFTNRDDHINMRNHMGKHV
jgi:hypothetical protein